MTSEYIFAEQKSPFNLEGTFILAERQYEENILLQQIIEEENKAVLFTVKLGTPIRLSPYFYQKPYIYGRKQQLGDSLGPSTTQPDTLLSPAFGRKR